MSRLLLCAFALAVVADLVVLCVGSDTGHAVAKPFLMPLLAAYAYVRRAPRLLLGALLLGWAGDVLLLFDTEPAFLAGMASFAAGHVCYLVLFRRYDITGHEAGNRPPRARPAFPALAYPTVLVTTVSLLWPDLPADLRIPIAGYSTLLTAMAYTAATRCGFLAGIGGTLFVLSDTLIATRLADWPQLPRPDVWIMLTYAAAQLLLVSGTLAAIKGAATTTHHTASPATG